MRPVLVRVAATTSTALLIGFSTKNNEVIGVLNWPDGTLSAVPIEDITIDRPNPDYPLGLGSWSANRQLLDDQDLDAESGLR